jgi:mono/diheme cytochrome c family protein
MKRPFIAFQMPKWLGVFLLLALAMNLIFIGCEYAPPENSRPVQIARGKQLYAENCAGCHGKDGKGGIDTMGIKTSNLTLIQEAWGGGEQFPIVEVAQKIDGRAEVKAHGPREMPAWGDVFANEEKLDENAIRGKMGDLISYLMTIQE